MISRFSVSMFAVLLATSAASAQGEPWRFHWRTGQTLNYSVEHATAIEEVVESQTTTTRSKVQNTKHWLVLEIDSQGIATLQLTLKALRMEMTTPNGEVMTFDSASPEQGNAALRTQMEKYLGQPLAIIRVDPRGQVIEVKECKFGPASRFESEPPFAVVLPEVAGASWERSYKLTLEPPRGTGEKYDAVQNYTSRTEAAGMATIAISTAPQISAGSTGRPNCTVPDAARRRGHLRPTSRPHAQRQHSHRQGSKGPAGRRKQLPLPKHLQRAIHRRELRFRNLTP